jgi:hypothetical protein
MNNMVLHGLKQKIIILGSSEKNKTTNKQNNELVD